MSGKVILITGASKGIGLACTHFLLEKFSARVVAVSRTRSPALDELEIKHKDNLTIIQGDVSSPEITSSAVATTIQKYGHLDSLILNAGTLHPLGRIASTSLAPLPEWRNAFELNFFSLVHTLQAAIPHLRSKESDGDIGGRVIFVSSGAATGGVAAWGAYSATKAAMNSLSRTLANEEPSIVSVALRPGMVDTDMQSILRSQGGAEMDPRDHKKFKDVHANSDLVTPEQAGHVIASLAVSASKELSGSFVTWNGDECKEHRGE